MTTITINPNRVNILTRLFREKIQPGNISDICRQLDGVNYKQDTYVFLRELVVLSCLTRFFMTRKDLGIIDGMYFSKGNPKPSPAYEVNKKKISELWKQRPEYILSRLILEEDAYVIE